MSEGATAESRVHSPWKRSACDRCRSQKLRCLRQEDDTTGSAACLRCIRCRTTCFTSSAKPLGRPSKSSARAKHQRSQSSASGEMPDFERTSNPRSHPISALPISHSPLGSFVMPTLEHYTPPPADDLGLYDYFVDDSSSSSSIFLGGGSTANLFDDRVQAHFALGTGAILSPPTESFQPDRAEALQAFGVGESESSEFDMGIVLANLHQSLSRQLYLVRTVPWDSSVLASHSPAGLKMELEASETGEFNPLAALIGTTADFLEVARLFRAGEEDSDFLSSLHGSGSDLLAPGSAHHHDHFVMPSPPLPSPSVHSLASSLHSPPVGQSFFSSPLLPSSLFPVGPSSESSSASSGASQGPAATHMLSALSCYLQTVSIYDAILTHVLVQVAAAAPSSDPLGAMLQGSSPGLFFAGQGQGQGGGGLLARLVVQVVENQLEMVEGAIGLPREYRITAGAAYHASGLLGGPDGMGLLRLVIGSALDGADEQFDLRPTASLRDSIRRVRQLL